MDLVNCSGLTRSLLCIAGVARESSMRLPRKLSIETRSKDHGRWRRRSVLLFVSSEIDRRDFPKHNMTLGIVCAPCARMCE